MLVESGQDLEVYCTLSGDVHGAHINASMLDVSLPMSSDHMHTVIDERTLKVVFHSLWRNMSHQQVFCELPGYERYAQTTVVVAGWSWLLSSALVVMFFCSDASFLF